MDADRDKGKDRYTVPEAAEALGVSQDAVRKRIHRNTIEHTRDESGKVYVRLDPSETRQDTGEATDREALLEAYRDQVAQLKEQLASERDANRENRRIIAGLVQRVPELEAANVPEQGEEGHRAAAGEPGRAREAEQQAEAQPTPQRPWWRRIIGG